MDLVNLDATTRQLMVEEIKADIDSGRLYMGTRLSAQGRQDYPGLLLEAASSGDVASLAAALQAGGRLEAYETTHTRNGKCGA